MVMRRRRWSFKRVACLSKIKIGSQSGHDVSSYRHAAGGYEGSFPMLFASRPFSLSPSEFFSSAGGNFRLDASGK